MVEVTWLMNVKYVSITKKDLVPAYKNVKPLKYCLIRCLKSTVGSKIVSSKMVHRTPVRDCSSVTTLIKRRSDFESLVSAGSISLWPQLKYGMYGVSKGK